MNDKKKLKRFKTMLGKEKYTAMRTSAKAEREKNGWSMSVDEMLVEMANLMLFINEAGDEGRLTSEIDEWSKSRKLNL